MYGTEPLHDKETQGATESLLREEEDVSPAPDSTLALSRTSVGLVFGGMFAFISLSVAAVAVNRDTGGAAGALPTALETRALAFRV